MAIYHLSHTYIGKGSQAQAHTAAAHADYITRPTRASEVMGNHMPTNWRQAMTWLQAQEDADRKNARVIDKVEIALPKELTHEQNAELVRAFCDEMTRGRAAWLAAMHDGPQDSDNPHAHIIFRDRDFETGRRVMETTERGSTERFREGWERHANHALAQAGLDVRIDRRTLEAQGIDRDPQIHVGPKAQLLEEQDRVPASRLIEVQRIIGNTAQPIVIDYPAIDGGRTRAEHNAAIIERNMQREGEGRQHAAGDAGLDWAEKGGMVAQQRAAMEWVRKAQQRHEQAQPAQDPPRSERTVDPRPEITDARAAKSDRQQRLEQFLARRQQQREGLARDQDEDDGREL